MSGRLQTPIKSSRSFVAGSRIAIAAELLDLNTVRVVLVMLTEPGKDMRLSPGTKSIDAVNGVVVLVVDIMMSLSLLLCFSIVCCFYFIFFWGEGFEWRNGGGLGLQRMPLILLK